jgi:NAD+ kinase
MKKIGIIFNKERKPEAEKSSLEIAEWLREKGREAYVNPSKSILSEGLDLVVVVGGDGTILRIADKIARFSIPLVGVNFGHRGYLCDIGENEIFKKLEKMLQGNFKIEEKTRIQAEVFNKKKIVREIDGLNEILIGGISRTVFLEIEAIDKNRSFKATVTGDGVLFATKTGSTGYNINAGGPALVTDAFSVVASNAYFSSDFLIPNMRSFVKENLPFLAADGQRDYRLKEGDIVRIKRSKYKTLFMKVG